MHVAIVGAGALGSVYGARLAQAQGVDVTFVDRPERALPARPIRVERVDHDEALAIDAPARAASIPAHADAAIVCVRYHRLDDDLRALLAAGPDAPIVVMTPMLPRDREAMARALGDRVIAAMPGVTAYVNAGGTVRYWLPRSTTTQLDELRPMPAAAVELSSALERAGIPCEVAMGVHERAPATAIAFAPLAAAVGLAGSVDALLEDDDLLSLALDAAHEARELARSVGEIAPFANILLKFVSKLTIKMGVTLARTHSPEALAYVDDRFGRARAKEEQAAMSGAVVELARAKGAPSESLERLHARIVVA